MTGLVIGTILFITTFVALITLFYFRDYTKFEREGMEEPKGLSGVLNNTLKKAYTRAKWAVNDSDRFKLQILGDSEITFIRYKILIAIVLALFSLVILKSVLVAVVLAVLGWFIPTFIINSQYSTWTSRIATEIPALTKYLALYINMGFNMRNSLESSLPYIEGPLNTLLKQAVVNISRDGNYDKHIKDIRSKVRGKFESHVDAVLKRIIQGWTSPNPTSFRDLDKFLAELEEEGVKRSTGNRKFAYLALLPVSFITVGLMIIGTMLQWLTNTLTSF